MGQGQNLNSLGQIVAAKYLHAALIWFTGLRKYIFSSSGILVLWSRLYRELKNLKKMLTLKINIISMTYLIVFCRPKQPRYGLIKCYFPKKRSTAREKNLNTFGLRMHGIDRPRLPEIILSLFYEGEVTAPTHVHIVLKRGS